MEVGQPNDASNDDVFEYNNHLPEEAQVIWLAEWLRQKQREFNLNSDLIAQNTAYVKKLADLFKESYEGCIDAKEYLWLDRDDDTYTALLYLPWINRLDQETFVVTLTYLMPKARIAIRHLCTIVVVDNIRHRVKGFRVLISEGQTQLAFHAIMLADPCQQPLTD